MRRKKRRLLTTLALAISAAVAVVLLMPHGSSSNNAPNQPPKPLPASLKTIFANASHYPHTDQYPKGNTSGIGAITIVSVQTPAHVCPEEEIVTHGEYILGKANALTTVTPPPPQNPYLLLNPGNSAIVNTISIAERTGRELYIQFAAAGGGVTQQQSQSCQRATYNNTQGVITGASLTP